MRGSAMSICGRVGLDAGVTRTLGLCMFGLAFLGCAEGETLFEDGSGGGTSGTGGATGGASSTTSTNGPAGPGGGADGGSGGGSVGAQNCPDGEFAVGLSGGKLDCASIDDAARTAINAHCSLYFGWRDSCGSCGLEPTKWGNVSGTNCTNGLGANGTCTEPTLGGEFVRLFGLNTAGDVGDDDKFYFGLHCAEVVPAVMEGGCPAGSFMTGESGGDITCTSLDAAATTYFEDNCSVYAGWLDNCDGCTTAPSRWGKVGGSTCVNGAGGTNTCSLATLGGESVTLFGLNTGGDVNDDDKFYFGLSCALLASEPESASGSCPDGQFVVGIDDGGELLCKSPNQATSVMARDACYLYAGWRDSCSGCTTTPAKWGRASTNACEASAGIANTCTKPVLGGTTVELFGLNTDGDVGGDDKFYVSLRCL